MLSAMQASAAMEISHARLLGRGDGILRGLQQALDDSRIEGSEFVCFLADRDFKQTRSNHSWQSRQLDLASGLQRLYRERRVSSLSSLCIGQRGFTN